MYICSAGFFHSTFSQPRGVGSNAKMKLDTATEVATRIRDLREAQNLSIRELARRSGMPPEVLSRSERKVTEITVTSLAKVCSGLGMTLSEFFSFQRVPKANPPISADVQRVLGMLMSLPPRHRQKVARAIAVMLEAGAGQAAAKEQGGGNSKRAQPRA